MRLKKPGWPGSLYLLIAGVTCLNLFFIALMLWSLGNIKENLLNNKVVASIVTSEEDSRFLKQVSGDLGIKNEVVMVEGPYYVHPDTLIGLYRKHGDDNTDTRRLISDLEKIKGKS